MDCRGRGLGPFPCSHVIAASCFWQWRHLQLVAVKASYGKLRKVDGEPPVVLGQQAHALAPEHFAQKYVVLLPTKMTMRPGTAVPARAPETCVPTADRPPRAFASAALRGDARGCIPGESGPACVAARAGWLPAAGPSPASGCDASVRAGRSAPDALPRCVPARSPT